VSVVTRVESRQKSHGPFLALPAPRSLAVVTPAGQRANFESNAEDDYFSSLAAVHQIHTRRYRTSYTVHRTPPLKSFDHHILYSILNPQSSHGHISYLSSLISHLSSLISCQFFCLHSCRNGTWSSCCCCCDCCEGMQGRVLVRLPCRGWPRKMYAYTAVNCILCVLCPLVDPPPPALHIPSTVCCLLVAHFSLPCILD
jgi:hypothetical protein